MIAALFVETGGIYFGRDDEPGPGHPNTLDGFRDWCVWRNDQEAARRERARRALLVGGEK